jgi:hypothetical protein
MNLDESMRTKEETSLLTNEQSSNDDREEYIDREFENYLNDDDEEFYDILPSYNELINVNSDDLNILVKQKSKELHEKRHLKFKKLESLDFTIENVDELRRIALDKYGFLNKRFRRKAWPVLVMAKNKSIGGQTSMNDYMKTSIDYYNQLGFFCFFLLVMA